MAHEHIAVSVTEYLVTHMHAETHTIFVTQVSVRAYGTIIKNITYLGRMQDWSSSSLPDS